MSQDFISLTKAEVELLRKQLECLEAYLVIYDDEKDDEPRRRVSKPKAGHPQKDRKAPKRKCSVCGSTSHRADSCTERKPNDEEEDGDDDDDIETENGSKEVTRERIQELKDEGLTSLQVAQRLGCRLSDVNKHWI
jgi:hypothetical protein